MREKWERWGQESHLRLFSRSRDPSVVVVKAPEYRMSDDTQCLLQVFMTTIVWWVWYALTKTLIVCVQPGGRRSS
jgi:hypothetical protein